MFNACFTCLSKSIRSLANALRQKWFINLTRLVTMHQALTEDLILSEDQNPEYLLGNQDIHASSVNHSSYGNKRSTF